MSECLTDFFYPHISFNLGPLEPLELRFVEIPPGPYPTKEKAIGQLEGWGFTSAWSQEPRLVWVRCDLANTAILHACEPVPAEGRWIIMYRKVNGRHYLAHDPGKILEPLQPAEVRNAGLSA